MSALAEALASLVTHKHMWVTQKLKELLKEGFPIKEEHIKHLDYERDVLYCLSCRNNMFLLPQKLHNKALRLLGHSSKQEEDLQKYLETLVEVIKKASGDQSNWPRQWSELGYPRLKISNPAFINKIGGQNAGGVDLLKSVGFQEEDGEYLTLKTYDKDTMSEVTSLVEKEIESLKGNKGRLLCVDYSQSFAKIVKLLFITMAKKKYGEEDYLAMCDARDSLREIIDGKYVSAEMIPQAKELFEQLPSLIGSIIIAWQERERKEAIKKAFGQKDDSSDDEAQEKMLKEELIKRQQMLQMAQEVQKMRDEQKKGIQIQGQKISQEEYLERKEREQLDEAIQRSLSDQNISSHGADNMEVDTPTQRAPSKLVGLKNIANNCYFNSLIQTYYLIPQLRSEILRFRGKKSNNSTPKQARALRFIQELQKLFAEMMLSKRAAVDPTPVLRALLTGSSKLGMQEDVHEINLLILETIEEAFNVNHMGSVVKTTFFGDISEEFKDSSIPEKKDKVAHLLLDVNSNQRTLYQSLDAYMYDTTINYSGRDVRKISSFDRLPEILIFQLKRTQFDTEHGAFKVNDPFKFYETISMDRYLHPNAAASAEIREHIRSWENEKIVLEKKLKQFTEYQNTGMGITDMLSGALHYLSQEKSEDSHFQEQLEAHIKKNLEKVSQEIGVLKSNIQALQQKIDNVYKDTDSEANYKLHSVLVHDGIAGVGHYWTFVHNHVTGKWIKFNDSVVKTVDKETVFRESEGGTKSMNAYCLFYVSELALAQSLSITEENLITHIPETIKQSILNENASEEPEDGMVTLLNALSRGQVTIIRQ